MTDIEKIKIDLLRDALKDVIDTVRALDRKIVFLASYNAVFLGIIFSFFFKYNNIVEQVNYSQYFYPLLGILTLIWVFNFIRVMIGISPRSNPVEVFKSEEDKLFSNNIFFVSTDAKENSLVLDDMLINYSEIDNYEGLQKLLYKEIGKVSYIRDYKLKWISESIITTGIITVCFIVLITIFLLLSLKVN